MATATELEAGKLDNRLELMVNDAIDAAINEVAAELAGGKSAKMFRSKATRKLLAEAIMARAERAARARRKVGAEA